MIHCTSIYPTLEGATTWANKVGLPYIIDSYPIRGVRVTYFGGIEHLLAADRGEENQALLLSILREYDERYEEDKLLVHNNVPTKLLEEHKAKYKLI